MIESTLFFVIAFFMVVTAALVAFRPKPIESALWLIVNFFFTSSLYVLLGSHFVAVIQILVYAGAIVVLFTFVILLLNLNPKELGGPMNLSWASMVLFVSTIAIVLFCIRVTTPTLLEKLPALPAPQAGGFGSVESFSRVFLAKYIWSFEVAGVMLLLAIVVVGLLAHRRRRVEGGDLPHAH